MDLGFKVSTPLDSTTIDAVPVAVRPWAQVLGPAQGRRERFAHARGLDRPWQYPNGLSALAAQRGNALADVNSSLDEIAPELRQAIRQLSWTAPHVAFRAPLRVHPLLVVLCRGCDRRRTFCLQRQLLSSGRQVHGRALGSDRHPDSAAPRRTAYPDAYHRRVTLQSTPRRNKPSRQFLIQGELCAPGS